MKRGLLLCFLIALTCLSAAQAAIETRTFEDDAQRERYQSLIDELRCPKCQNQNIADSNAPIAQDMRDEVYRQLQDGAENQAIVDSLVARFGEFVRYRPQVEPRTWLLWFGPALAALVGFLVVWRIGRRSRPVASEKTALTAEERERAKRLLDEASEQDQQHSRQ
ncbi:cytochrome c-type biogenesis protein CcmH [Marinobacteraceae bacterium S3BR75-40.1]